MGEGKLEVTKKMFIAGIDVEQIRTFTDIQIKDLIELITENNETERG